MNLDALQADPNAPTPAEAKKAAKAAKTTPRSEKKVLATVDGKDPYVRTKRFASDERSYHSQMCVVCVDGRQLSKRRKSWQRQSTLMVSCAGCKPVQVLSTDHDVTAVMVSAPGDHVWKWLWKLVAVSNDLTIQVCTAVREYGWQWCPFESFDALAVGCIVSRRSSICRISPRITFFNTGRGTFNPVVMQSTARNWVRDIDAIGQQAGFAGVPSRETQADISEMVLGELRQAIRVRSLKYCELAVNRH